MSRRGIAAIGACLIALAAFSSPRSASVRIGLEDRADPNPRQVVIAVEIASMALSFAISWTERLARAQ